MLKNYITGTFRSIIRNKLSSFICIFGLSIGITCSILTGLYASYEFSFDRFHSRSNNTYRLLRTSEDKSFRGPIFPATYLPEIQERLPGVDNAVRVNQISDGIFSHNGENMVIDHVMFTDADFFEVFSFTILYGKKDDLNQQMKVFVSESFAEQHFKGSDPINKILLYENEHEFEIVGIIEDIPSNSIFQADIIVSFESRRKINPYEFEYWYAKGTHIYMVLDKNTVIRDFISSLILTHNNVKPDYESEGYFDLEPIKNIHLHSYNTQWDVNTKKSDIKVIMGIIFFTAFILIISVANYSIMNVSRFHEKIEQLKIRKIIGADIRQLLGQLAVETAFMILIAAIISLYLIGMLFPLIAHMGYKDIFLSIILSFQFLGYLVSGLSLLFVLIIIYPFFSVLKLSTVKTYSAKKVKWKKQLISSSVSLQFAFTIIIIISSLIIYQQIRFVTKQKLGFDREQLLLIDNPWDMEMGTRYIRFKDAAEKLNGVCEVTATRNSPFENINNGGAFYMTSDETKWINAGRVQVDNNFFNVMQSRFIDGTGFSDQFEINKNSIILNQTAFDEIGDTKAVGNQLVYPSIREEPFTLTGVVEDIQHENTLQPSRAVVYFQAREDRFRIPDIMVKLNADDHRNTVTALENIWQDLAPQWPFMYEFMDDRINSVYKNENRALGLLTILAIISIIISCIGILGLSWMTITQRTKEIGIRKVNGAMVGDMMILLNKDYIRWIAIGFIMATPVSWYVMKLWLQNFTYKITISWLVFVIAGIVTLSIALLTVSYQTFKAARRNPVEALRYE